MSRLLGFIGLFAISMHGYAELQPLEDAALSEVTGQAFVSIDRTAHPDEENLTYTRINLGMDIETQLNIEKFDLGRYSRVDPLTGAEERQSSDILINNFSFGHIYSDQYYNENPTLIRPRKPNGSAYQDGEIVPFRMRDPFFEFAFDGEGLDRQVVGVRFGFGESEGVISGDIESLTGNVDVAIRGTVQNFREAIELKGGCEGTVECLISTFGGIVGGLRLGADANLVYPEIAGHEDLHGEADAARATHIGMLNGNDFSLDLGFLGTLDFQSNDCRVLGIEVCFPLTQFKSLDIGKREGLSTAAGPIQGLFLSAQTRALPWLKDLKGSVSNSENYVDTVSGAFLNIPTGGLQVDFVSAVNGIPRVRTEYIDRGVGMF